MKTGIILRKNEKISIKREKIRKNTKKRFTISKKYVMMLGGILYPVYHYVFIIYIIFRRTFHNGNQKRKALYGW
jgi:hypothetical protein